MCPVFPFLTNKEVKSSVKRVHVFIVTLCGPEGVVLQQNNILQQVIQQVHHDSNLHGAISEQQENIGLIIAEVNRLKRRPRKTENGIATRFYSY